MVYIYLQSTTARLDYMNLRRIVTRGFVVGFNIGFSVTL